MQASELNRDPRQEEVEVEFVHDKNTSRSKGSWPMSSNLSRGGLALLNAKEDSKFSACKLHKQRNYRGGEGRGKSLR